MITKKKPIKVRRRILSNKRTKGGNKKQHSKKRRTKIKGGVPPSGDLKVRKPITLSTPHKKKASKINTNPQLEKKASKINTNPQLDRKPKNKAISFVLVDLHGSYEDKKEGIQPLYNEKMIEKGVGLRDDIMTWFFARYTNSTPNIPLDQVLPIFVKERHNWEKIFIGLKQMETDYKNYYNPDIIRSCPNKENNELALNFINELSVPFQAAIKQGIEEGGSVGEIYLKKCSGLPQAGSHKNHAILEREKSQRLQDTACGCEKANVQSNSWLNFIKDLVIECYDSMYPPKYVDSKWHIAATLSAIKHIYDSDASISDASIIKRQNQLFCLSYDNDPKMSITIFTKKRNLDYALKEYHLVKLGTDENGLINTRFFSYITHIDPSQGIDVTCIKIFYRQFENIQKHFSLNLGNRNQFVNGNFETNNIFFIDDINFILYNLFNLSQDEIINFYESCRGRPDAS